MPSKPCNLDRPLTVVQDSELGPLTTTTAYLSNVSGPYVQVTSPRGQVTRTWHQSYDQPSDDFPVIIQNLGGQYTYITRDPFGKPTSLRRSDSNTPTGGTGINRLYTYNTYQELCRTVEPETGATLMGYDAAGNLAWSASGLPAATACDIEGDTAAILARKAARTYDARNRLKTLTFPDHRGDQVWTYTPNSLPATLTAANPNVASPTRTSYTYSRRGLLAKEVLQPLGGTAAFAANYGYDANGFMSQIGYPSALTVLLSPDALGRPTRAGTYATDVRYHPNGAIAQFTYGNGIVHTMAQNARGLPDTSTDVYGSTAFLSDGLDYDQNGNPAAITDGATGRSQRGNRTMVYDALDRLTSVTSPMFGTATYAYDALDNLTHAKVSGGSKVRDHYYCSNAQWQVAFVRTGPTCTGSTPSPAVLAIEYDVQGNVSNRDSAGFGFDFGNRLRTSPGLWYAYDGLGRRILSCTTGACSYQFYTQAGQRLYVDNKAADQPTDYIYLGNSLVAQRTLTRATGVYDTRYLHTDALGSPVLVTNEARAVVERSEYEPYGQVLNRPLRDGPGYTGHVEDKTTGMVYMQQRYYDPSIGRFLSVDPVTAYSMPGSNFNRYWYANNNPYKFTDPDGRIALIDDAAGFLVGGVIGVVVQTGVSVATGQDMTWGDAAGAFVSGGIVGVGAVNAPETGGISFAVAVGGVAGAAGNSVKQGVDIATGDQTNGFSGKDVAFAGAFGMATAGVTEGALSNAKIPGLSSGRNNMNAVGKAAQTRIANGNASRMSGKTAVKAAIGSQAAGAKKTVGEAAIEVTKNVVCSGNKDVCN